MIWVTTILTIGADVGMVVCTVYLLVNMWRFFNREMDLHWEWNRKELAMLAQEWGELIQEIRAKWAEFKNKNRA